jgi:hypothetical protein
MTDTTFDFDYWLTDHDAYYTGDPSDAHFDDPCHRGHALFGSNTGSSGRNGMTDSSDYATMAAGDDNVYFAELDLYQLSMNGAAPYAAAAATRDDNFWDLKLQTSTFSITWFWFIPNYGDELMIVKGRPDTGFTITPRCDMGPGGESCSGTGHMLSFDLQYIICFVRFGYNPVQSNGTTNCGWTDEGADITSDGCTSESPCDITYGDCEACRLFGCSDFDLPNYGVDLGDANNAYF